MSSVKFEIPSAKALDQETFVTALSVLSSLYDVDQKDIEVSFVVDQSAQSEEEMLNKSKEMLFREMREEWYQKWMAIDMEEGDEGNGAGE